MSDVVLSLLDNWWVVGGLVFLLCSGGLENGIAGQATFFIVFFLRGLITRMH